MNTMRHVETERTAGSRKAADPLPSELSTISLFGQVQIAVTLAIMTWALARLAGQLLG